MLTWPQSSLKGLPIITAWPLATLIPQEEFCPVSKKQRVPCTKNVQTCLCHEITPDWHKPLGRVLEEALGNSLDFHRKVPNLTEIAMIFSCLQCNSIHLCKAEAEVWHVHFFFGWDDPATSVQSLHVLRQVWYPHCLSPTWSHHDCDNSQSLKEKPEADEEHEIKHNQNMNPEMLLSFLKDSPLTWRDVIQKDVTFYSLISYYIHSGEHCKYLLHLNSVLPRFSLFLVHL